MTSLRKRECIRCLMLLPFEAFSPRERGRNGLDAACKACESERLSVRKHGITSLEKEQLADQQGGCATCGRTTPGRKGGVVDHDRSCCPGDVSCPSCRRGILCQWCNASLGYALDNTPTLRRMADYIELGTILRTESASDPQAESAVASNERTERTNATQKPITDVYLETAVDASARTKTDSSGVGA